MNTTHHRNPLGRGLRDIAHPSTAPRRAVVAPLTLAEAENERLRHELARTQAKLERAQEALAKLGDIVRQQRLPKLSCAALEIYAAMAAQKD